MLSCDSGGNATACEQIVGEWEFIDIYVDFIELCEDFDIENFQDYFIEGIKKNITITTGYTCIDNQIIFNIFSCPSYYNEACVEPISGVPFNIDEDIMTFPVEDIRDVSTEYDCISIFDINVVYQRAN